MKENNLLRYPRPSHDTGIGLVANPNLHYAATGADTLPTVGARWTVLNFTEQQAEEVEAVAQTFWRAGVMPILHPRLSIDAGSFAWETLIERLRKHSIPAYIQLFGDPVWPDNWNVFPAHSMRVYASQWSTAAKRISESGGWPGFTMSSKDLWFEFVTMLGRSSPLWERAWWAFESQALNLPPAYPYDLLNTFNPTSSKSPLPGSTLSFLLYGEWMVDRLGYTLPVIGVNNGWRWGAAQDADYPMVLAELHAAYHQELYQWMRTRTLPNGMELPDYLFALSAYAESNAGTSSWFGNAEMSETVELLQSYPVYIRRSSWELPHTETEQEGVLRAANARPWSTHIATSPLRAYALEHALGWPRTEQFTAGWEGKTYRAQVFEGGVVYADAQNYTLGSVKWIALPQ